MVSGGAPNLGTSKGQDNEGKSIKMGSQTINNLEATNQGAGGNKRCQAPELKRKKGCKTAQWH